MFNGVFFNEDCQLAIGVQAERRRRRQKPERGCCRRERLLGIGRMKGLMNRFHPGEVSGA